RRTPFWAGLHGLCGEHATAALAAPPPSARDPDRAITCPAVLNRIATSVGGPCSNRLSPRRQDIVNLTPVWGGPFHTIVSVTVGVVDLGGQHAHALERRMALPGGFNKLDQR
ncbi:MAG: hypothetical protein KDB51_09455, partial [Propionibacteriaceae bacterium]|nr:hypothetical protein [Propionibacteriaceae bacterium]